MLRKLTTTALLTVSLGAGSCTQPVGDYCDLYLPVKFSPDVARYVVANDRPAAERVDVNNQTFGRCP